MQAAPKSTIRSTAEVRAYYSPPHASVFPFFSRYRDVSSIFLSTHVPHTLCVFMYAASQTIVASSYTYTADDLCGEPGRSQGWRSPGYFHTTVIKVLHALFMTSSAASKIWGRGGLIFSVYLIFGAFFFFFLMSLFFFLC